MKVAGIIAEYNPFHLGHKYQLDTLHQQYQPDYVIIAMSGDFLQRGTPALMDKYTRAHMALLQGADLILELPSFFSTASAESFARGGIRLLQTTGLTDLLCFGAESDDLPRLRSLARLLHTEPDWYQAALRSYLKEGLSFPTARAKALPEYADLLDSPNNILATEYLKALELSHASDFHPPQLEPVLIQRKGSGYHDTNIHVPLASASAIRKILLSSTQHQLPPEIPAALPPGIFQMVRDYEKHSAFLEEDDFSLLLHHALLRESKDSLLSYADMTVALANRISQQKRHFVSWSSFCEACNTRTVTYARISRVLTHLMLDIKEQAVANYSSSAKSPLPYLRVLGFRKSAAPLLSELKHRAFAPLITAPSAAATLLDRPGLAMFHTDLYASDLYRSVMTEKTRRAYPNEYRRKLLVVD